MWFSTRSSFLAAGDERELSVTGPGCAARLSGTLAREFLQAFLSEGGASAPRLESLRTLGSEVHAALAEAARRGGGRAWRPLSSTHAPSTLFLEVSGRCNERCVHCYADAAPEVGEALDADTCLRVLREGADLGFERLQLTGGDPLLCAFLPELAQEARAAGYESIEVYTNGLALSADRLDALAVHGVRFAFSFYSHDPAAHDAITGVPGSHRRTRDAIARAVSRGLEVRIAVVLTEANATHFEQTRASLVAVGVPADRIGWDRLRGVGRGARGARSLPMAGGAKAPEQAPGAHGHTESDPICDAPRWPGKLCVAYTGAVYPCIFSRWLELGHVSRERLSDIVERARGGLAGQNASTLALEDRLACLDCRITAMALGQAAP